MVFIACGLNHKTAPIDIREQLASSSALEQAEALLSLKGQEGIQEAVLLSTCNRTEIYCDASSAGPAFSWLSKHYQFCEDKLKQHAYSYLGQLGIKHAIRVSAGLDSMMLGEPQIFGQIKNAYQLAEEQQTIGHTLRPIFHHIFSASKKIRTNTELGVNPVSIAYAGVRLISDNIDNLEQQAVLLIGAGETSRLVAKYLFDSGIQNFYVANRSLENAKALAEEFKGQAISISDLSFALEKANIIVSATACPLPFISKNLVANIIKDSPDAKKLFLDLALPRDIEPNVAELSNVKLFNIDHLHNMVTESLTQRQEESHKAEEIIDFELNEYINWHRGQRAKDMITKYRGSTQHDMEEEVNRALTQLNKGIDAETCIRELAYRLQQKFVHKPTVGLRQAARHNRQDLVDLATFLFHRDSKDKD